MGWAAAFGAMLAGMHATKETFVIAGFAACVGIGVLIWRSRGTEAWQQVRARACAPGPMLLAAGVMLLVSITLFTCFFSDASGPWHSITTYGKYLGRGAGSEDRHVHPWYWYGWMLTWYQPRLGPWFSEAPALLLGLIGAVVSFGGWGVAERHRSAAIFVATYTLVLAACYAVIPYKTPWCLLGFWHGMLLLAGIGIAALWQMSRRLAVRTVVLLCVLMSFVFLGWMADRVNRTFDTDTRNPYVYAHPLRSVTRFEQRVAQVAAVHPDGWAMPVKIFEQGNNWPIPFYLRRLERYGTWSSVDQVESPDAAMIFVDPELQDAVDAKRKGAYHIEYLSLRPREVRAVYVRQDLWDAIKARGQP